MCHTVAQMDVEASLPIAPKQEVGAHTGVGGGDGGKQQGEGEEEEEDGSGGGEEGRVRRGGRKRGSRVTPAKNKRKSLSLGG